MLSGRFDVADVNLINVDELQHNSTCSDKALGPGGNASYMRRKQRAVSWCDR
ncbi:hypothetical protein DPMN_118265 [Dreissena polymorpha]|uniref:Uncharacterized protein n=1 Tax=Dreissena polymorpha TaxID=45954 RepID=A0A9D4GGF8_DREPO|nr:hypothetical protein DPMN_118265 [Dreissena polymorpha]